MKEENIKSARCRFGMKQEQTVQLYDHLGKFLINKERTYFLFIYSYVKHRGTSISLKFLFFFWKSKIQKSSLSTCCATFLSWCMAVRYLRTSLVASVFPDPLSPLKQEHNNTARKFKLYTFYTQCDLNKRNRSVLPKCTANLMIMHWFCLTSIIAV